MSLFRSDTLHCMNCGKIMRLWRKLWFIQLQLGLQTHLCSSVKSRKQLTCDGQSFLTSELFWFLKTNTVTVLNGPRDHHEPWPAPCWVLSTQASGDLQWVKELHTRGRASAWEHPAALCSFALRCVPNSAKHSSNIWSLGTRTCQVLLRAVGPLVAIQSDRARLSQGY